MHELYIMKMKNIIVATEYRIIIGMIISLYSSKYIAVSVTIVIYILPHHRLYMHHCIYVG